MAETIANGIEDKLIDGLSFEMNPGASCLTDRQNVTHHPQGEQSLQNQLRSEVDSHAAHW